MTDVHADAHEFMAILHQAQDVEWRRILFVTGPMIMNRDSDSVLPRELFHGVERFRLRAANDGGHSRIFGVIEVAPDLRRVIFHVNDTTSQEREPGRLDFAMRLLALGWGALERK